MITIDEMRDKLLTLDEVKERLEPTENLYQYPFSTDGNDKIKFDFPNDWSEGLQPTDIAPVTIDINGMTKPLTAQAAFQAAAMAGLSEKSAIEFPGELLTMNMNYLYNHPNMRQKNHDKKLFASKDAGVAFARGTITPFSNIELLDSVVNVLGEKYSTDDIIADYKLHNDLKQTVIRLILPGQYRNIGSARAASSQEDPWSLGIELRNSLTGASSTQLHGYLFAWWCTNGATSTHAISGKYRRRPTAEPEEAYEWAASVVDDVLGGLEHEFDEVEQLTTIPLEGELNTTLGNMFDRFQVPVRTREAIILNLIDSDDLSAYGLMNAITQAGNNEDLSSGTVVSLLEAGGKLSHILSERCEVCHRF